MLRASAYDMTGKRGWRCDICGDVRILDADEDYACPWCEARIKCVTTPRPQRPVRVPVVSDVDLYDPIALREARELHNDWEAMQAYDRKNDFDTSI